MPKCLPGCTCGRHSRAAFDRKPCPPGCDCGKHKGPGSRKCEPGCTCSRHGRGACAPGCTCGKHISEGKSHPHAADCGCPSHNRPKLSGEERRRRKRVSKRLHYRNNTAKELARHASYRAENLEKRREMERNSARKIRAADPPRFQAIDRSRRHGLRAGQFEALWEAQGGRCCYCEQPLPREGASSRAVIDHDHTCCGPKRSCDACRRGLACNNCNVIVGMAYDDPDRLEIMAANLRAIAAATRERINGRPVQEELPINVARLRRKESALWLVWRRSRA